jgi:hypothetical protein
VLADPGQYERLIDTLAPREAQLRQEIKELEHFAQESSPEHLRKTRDEYCCLTFHLGNCHFHLKDYEQAI